MKYLFALLFLVSLSQSLLAQEVIGLNPPSLKWYQLGAPSGPVIYPEGMDSMAFRLAGIMAFQRQHDGSIVGTGKTKRVPTILQNQSAMPAGFSTPAPWRNEFYLTPPQNLFTGPVPWADYVTTHEYRHAQQFSMANGGTTLAFKILTGQTGWLLHALINEPLWFREGDAVTTETVLTKAGRGRQPRFHMETRALRLASYKFGYEKGNYPASFKHFVPNPYRIGYYMTTKLRREKGDSIWQKVLYDTYHMNPVYGFTRSLKKNAGLSAAQLYDQTNRELDSLWQADDRNLKLTQQTVLTRPQKVYTNYRFPHYLPDGSVVCLKDGFDEIRTFYRIWPDGREEKLFPYGVYTDDHVMFSAAGDKLTWAESSFDERYINLDFSVVKTYDMKTGKTRKLSSRSRYFAPTFSPDGNTILAVESDKNYKHRFVLLDADSGYVLRTIPNPGNAYLAQPRWQEDNRLVVALAVTEKGNSLIRVKVQTGEMQTLLPYTTTPIQRPFPQGDHVYFSAGYTGIDNIYALQLSTGKVFQVTSVRFGAYEPAISADGKKMVFSNYTAEGYRLEELALDPETWSEAVNILPSTEKLYQPLLKNAANHDLTDSEFRTNYIVTRYNAFTKGLFNIYGWFPTLGASQYGAEFYTRNIMSTLRGTVGVFYNTNENAFGSKLGLTYAALYPLIDLEGGLRTRRKAEIRDIAETEVLEQEWTEKYALAGIRFSFRLTQGKYRSNLELGGAYAFYKVDALSAGEDPETIKKFDFNSWRGTFSFSRLLPQARQQVKPRWGQTLGFEMQRAIGEEPERIYAEGQLYFPGFKRTHSLNFAGRWKQESIHDTYRFSDVFVMPRGFNPDPFNRIWVASANYEFPVWYPDLAVGPVAFLQRFRTNLFADHSEVRLHTRAGTLNSAGAELFVDLRLLRLFSMTMGFRYSFTSGSGLAETVPFQFVVSRFELAN